ncbi:hypothetical protein [Ramlibacter rhizophilus]|uniref:hypothetical protein n=1 Tax=Ramlibacter rhizophilus TaxID=1781167 RepID=UPI001F0FC807|nr:hypothetical protein [Ramlibacter rhizophilus]
MPAMLNETVMNGAQASCTPGGGDAAPELNVLLLYHSRQTFTNTVFEHVDAFARFSSHRYFFCHHDESDPFLVDLSKFDAVVIHYCLRMPMDQVSAQAAQRLAAFEGTKVLFLQDEYESTYRTWHWIERLGIDLVFTVVPQPHVARIYPPERFPRTRFVSNLTGYVPEAVAEARAVLPPSQRSTLVGYRGRHLPLIYGALGREKVGVGLLVRAYCERHGLPHDIEWREEARIYGEAWYPFVASCRAMLGSESGANVFDWDGTLRSRIATWLAEHPDATEDEAYQTVVRPLEMPGLMNQVSPRIFEAIALRTVLVLFEGSYSGVVEPWTHYIPLRKDGSNLDEVFRLLQDGDFVDAMSERAWRDVIGSGRYAYSAFIRMVDQELLACHAASLAARAPEGSRHALLQGGQGHPTDLTTLPIRCPPPVAAVPVEPPNPEPIPVAPAEPLSRWNRLRQAAVLVWSCLPRPAQNALRPIVNGVLRPMARALHRRRRDRLQRRRTTAAHK